MPQPGVAQVGHAGVSLVAVWQHGASPLQERATRYQVSLTTCIVALECGVVKSKCGLRNAECGMGDEPATERHGKSGNGDGKHGRAGRQTPNSRRP